MKMFSLTSPASRRPSVWMVGQSMAFALAALVISVGCDSAQNLGPPGSGSGGNFVGRPASAAPTFDNSLGATDDSQEQARASADLARAIEEADIVKRVGDRLYALNRYKGLLVIDVADPDNPALLGSLDLKGRGVEMYVSNDQAYVLLSADFYYVYDADIAVSNSGDVGFDGRASAVAPDRGPSPDAPDFEGSQLAIVDLTDPTKPTVQGKINLVGYANESRRVGDIIYVIGSSYAPYFALGGTVDDSTPGEGFVASVNVADPTDIQPVQRKVLAGNAVTMHASEGAIFAASHDYNFDEAESYTHIQIVDISDAAGAITLRGEFDVPGTIRNRFYMDRFGDTFRIATESFGFGFQTVALYTYDISDMDNVADLGSTDIIENESLEAVRFDGERAYAVTFFVTDPLFVIDLKDPANPTVAGELEVPGYSTHIEPRGDRLIAVGIDDTDGNRPAVAYYDVSDPANPVQLGRVILGPPGSYTSSDATYDEKAFKIVDELGLIAIPYQHIDYTEVNGDGEVPPDEPGERPDAGQDDFVNTAIAGDAYYYAPECTNGVQLVDFSDTALTQRGSFENHGNVSRVGVIGTRLFALSDLGLKTVDISDRDAPETAGEVMFYTDEELSRFDECGYGYYYPFDIEPGFPGGFNFPDLTAEQIDRLLALAENCAAGTPMPAAALLMAMFFMRPTIRRRRRR